MSNSTPTYCSLELLEYPGLKVRDSDHRRILDQCVNQGGGAIRLAPRWACREFCDPGAWMRRRLKPGALAPKKLKKKARVFRTDEWWGLCCIKICTGAELVTGGEPFREGQSHAYTPGRELMLFQDMIEANPELVLGTELAAKSRKRFGVPTVGIVSKRFCNDGPIPKHTHGGSDGDEDAKPEVHDFIAEDNPHIPPHHQITTAIGLHPWMTKQDFIDCMKRWGHPEGNGILNWAQYHRVPVGQGTFKCPTMLLHAPAAVDTHEVHFPKDSACTAARSYGRVQTYAGTGIFRPARLLVSDRETRRLGVLRRLDGFRTESAYRPDASLLQSERAGSKLQ